MIDQILEYTDKLGRLLSTFKVDVIIGALINVAIIIFLFKMTEMFSAKLLKKFTNEDKDSLVSHIIPILEKIVKFLIAFIVIASFLQSQGYSLTSLIAGFGITGLAVGFAAQQTIASVFGTISVLTDKIYKVGDYIKVNNFEGTVESISIRSTKIRTLDNFLITVPNDICADSVIENVSKAVKRKIDVTFTITYSTSDEKLQQAMNIIKSIASSKSHIHKDYHVFIDELADSSINIRFFGYAKTKSVYNLWSIKSEFIQEVVKNFRQENIEFAFPTQSIYIEK